MLLQSTMSSCVVCDCGISCSYSLYKEWGYSMDVMRLSAGLVVNPITVNGYVFLFKCPTVGQA